jgi:hypothetical protein
MSGMHACMPYREKVFNVNHQPIYDLKLYSNAKISKNSTKLKSILNQNILIQKEAQKKVKPIKISEAISPLNTHANQ